MLAEAFIKVTAELQGFRVVTARGGMGEFVARVPSDEHYARRGIRGARGNAIMSRYRRRSGREHWNPVARHGKADSTVLGLDSDNDPGTDGHRGSTFRVPGHVGVSRVGPRSQRRAGHPARQFAIPCGGDRLE